ncbi:hypothetical protein HYH03_009147 [Edaphochlamys debaryana]|uniref:Uncharacterized protein n=1 Tax=Edaphochlamys debaryana TaxID=47281 RepID=A0A835XWM9_9CHLO|nr:hypothetical protein HYH03_009147 [Edaphochlamys debaryana]|eukprot:KAG2492482.1 hypothetical protein HYH03_009147 [Edaphochlamys debaryana]
MRQPGGSKRRRSDEEEEEVDPKRACLHLEKRLSALTGEVAQLSHQLEELRTLHGQLLAAQAHPGAETRSTAHGADVAGARMRSSDVCGDSRHAPLSTYPNPASNPAHKAVNRNLEIISTAVNTVGAPAEGAHAATLSDEQLAAQLAADYGGDLTTDFPPGAVADWWEAVLGDFAGGDDDALALAAEAEAAGGEAAFLAPGSSRTGSPAEELGAGAGHEQGASGASGPAPAAQQPWGGAAILNAAAAAASAAAAAAASCAARPQTAPSAPQGQQQPPTAPTAGLMRVTAPAPEGLAAAALRRRPRWPAWPPPGASPYPPPHALPPGSYAPAPFQVPGGGPSSGSAGGAWWPHPAATAAAEAQPSPQHARAAPSPPAPQSLPQAQAQAQPPTGLKAEDLGRCSSSAVGPCGPAPAPARFSVAALYRDAAAAAAAAAGGWDWASACGGEAPGAPLHGGQGSGASHPLAPPACPCPGAPPLDAQHSGASSSTGGGAASEPLQPAPGSGPDSWQPLAGCPPSAGAGAPEVPPVATPVKAPPPLARSPVRAASPAGKGPRGAPPPGYAHAWSQHGMPYPPPPYGPVPYPAAPYGPPGAAASPVRWRRVPASAVRLPQLPTLPAPPVSSGAAAGASAPGGAPPAAAAGLYMRAYPPMPGGRPMQPMYAQHPLQYDIVRPGAMEAAVAQ